MLILTPEKNKLIPPKKIEHRTKVNIHFRYGSDTGVHRVQIWQANTLSSGQKSSHLPYRQEVKFTYWFAGEIKYWMQTIALKGNRAMGFRFPHNVKSYVVLCVGKGRNIKFIYN